MTATIIIPARYNSSRFPGKPLTKLKLKNDITKPLVQLTWEAAKRVQGINNIFIATDNRWLIFPCFDSAARSSKLEFIILAEVILRIRIILMY